MTSSSSALDGHTPELLGNHPDRLSAERPSIAQVLLPYWFSKDKWLALALLGIILTITFTGTYGHVALNKIQGQLTDALIALDWTALKPLLVMSMLLGLLTVLLPSISSYITGFLELRWRTWMTHSYLERWMRNSNFLKLERDGLISNPDQRIAEDIRLTVDQTLNLATSLISVVVNTVAYTVLLWNISGALDFKLLNQPISLPGYMVYVAYVYCICHLMLSHWLGKVLIGLNMHKQTVEAEFRHQGMLVREYAEQVAFYRGGEREKSHQLERFERIRKNTLNILLRTFKLNIGQHIFAHAFSLLPTLLALPLLLSGKISYGDMVRIAGAYGMLSNTIAFFPQAYMGFTNWLALTNRLRDLQWAVNKAELQKNQITYSETGNCELYCRELKLRTPLGTPLAVIKQWQVEKGQRWLIKGRSGSGKSTLLRACAGLWPYGEGQIQLPTGCRSFFLPQKSYIPAGTLKDALCYPHDATQFDEEQCRKALQDCCLSGLADSLSVNQMWQQTLSGGEQQRLAMARVLLHKPDFIFLDEATSALDPHTEHALYSALLEQLPSSALISVAHRESLATFHPHTLDLNA